MTDGLLSIRAKKEQIDVWKQAAEERGQPVSTWARDILNELVEAMGLAATAQPIEGQLTVDEITEDAPPQPSVPEPEPVLSTPPTPARLAPMGRPTEPPPEAQTGTDLKPTCQSAHLHFMLQRGQTCMFCGGTA